MSSKKTLTEAAKGQPKSRKGAAKSASVTTQDVIAELKKLNSDIRKVTGAGNVENVRVISLGGEIDVERPDGTTTKRRIIRVSLTTEYLLEKARKAMENGEEYAVSEAFMQVRVPLGLVSPGMRGNAAIVSKDIDGETALFVNRFTLVQAATETL